MKSTIVVAVLILGFTSTGVLVADHIVGARCRDVRCSGIVEQECLEPHDPCESETCVICITTVSGAVCWDNYNDTCYYVSPPMATQCGRRGIIYCAFTTSTGCYCPPAGGDYVDDGPCNLRKCYITSP